MTLHSKLIGHLFQRPRKSPVLTVLDVGCALPETVDFFSTQRSRIFFLDLYAEEFVRRQQEMEDDELRRAIVGALTMPSNTRLDICLFWDFLNYLDDRTLALFNELLAPYLQPSTSGHAFGTLNGRTPKMDHQYGIVDEGTISVRERTDTGEQACFPHSQSEMRRLVDRFEINRGVLLPDGRLEMLLESRRRGASADGSSDELAAGRVAGA